MRPRVFPAEDYEFAREHGKLFLASMRPRVFPAEDQDLSVYGTGTALGFNEAAGIPRGRRRVVDEVGLRPCRFNEAAGIPRGRLCRP